jgi:midasin
LLFREFEERTENGSGEQGPQTRQGGQESNPYQIPKQTKKTLADVFTEVQRRYQDILDGLDRDPNQNIDEDIQEVGTVEHTQDDTPQTKAALGQASENEMMRLRDLNIVDYPELPSDKDLDMPEEPQIETASHTQSQKIAQAHEEGSPQEKLETALTADQIRKSNRSQGSPSLEYSATTLLSKTDNSPISQEVEERLISWRSNPNSNDRAENIWRLYSSLTHELAWMLCEQLRLILEPTKATRLRGDYRSGKRLNMKKIIPYIASEYTKDKIWLRRTKPSQREYQIMLAMDDSKSMSESHSEHLAFQTLALVSKALTRLEAGDIAVAKFGEKVEIMHAFNDGPFNDAAGAKAIDGFSFAQNSTNVLELVETSLAFLQDARNRRSSSSSSSASALWQLQIIISDGICSNHDQLRATLRRAAEQRVMIVFIVVDSLSRSNQPHQSSMAQNSILSMKQVRADMTIERYLDTFPFEYYVIVRNVDSLPDVLCGTLKQFFERISEE